MSIRTPHPAPPGIPDHQDALLALLQPGSGPRQASRFEQFAAENQINLDLLWVLRDLDGRIESSVLCVPSAGRTAMVFLSPVLHLEQVEDRARLLQHALNALESADIDLAQALLPIEDELGSKAHLDGGFEPLATLLYMERPLSQAAPRPNTPPGTELVDWDENLVEELGNVLEATYENTLDCPGLCGLRRTQDIIAGHRAMGTVEPNAWKLLRVDGRFEGTILVNRAADNTNHELVYLGLSQAVRGRGLGRFLLQETLHRLAGGDVRRMALAVDSRNEPAIALYASLGFKLTLKRWAGIRSVASS